MKKLSKDYLLVIASGLLFSICVHYLIFTLAWICLVPLFISINKEGNKKTLFRKSIVFGATVGLTLYVNIIEIILDFTDGQLWISIVCFLLIVLLYSLYFTVLLFIYKIIKVKGKYEWLNGIAIASLWMLSDWVASYLFSGMPWLTLRIGTFVSRNIYAIQYASIGGVYLIGFVVVLVNYLLAFYISKKKWLFLSIPISLLAVYYVGGVLILHIYESNNKSKHQSVSIAILCENARAEEKWNKENGNRIAQRFFDLNKEAAKLKPQIILWTESAIPWTYRKDDEFINEVLKITAPNNITHIIGMNTDYKGDVVYNSAYCILPNGDVAGRYDKRVLLNMVEKPLGIFNLPFLSTDGFYAQPGNSSLPLPTPYGKAGVLICNESVVPGGAIDMLDNGADFLVNLSNDAWFCSSQVLINEHFFNARLRAVESRRDLVINSNMGFSGKINASGEIGSQIKSDEANVQAVTVEKNNTITFYSKNKSVFLVFYIIIFITFVIISLTKPKINQ